MFLTAYSQHLISTVFTQLLTSTFKDAWCLQFHSHSGDSSCRSVSINSTSVFTGLLCWLIIYGSHVAACNRIPSNGSNSILILLPERSNPWLREQPPEAGTVFYLSLYRASQVTPVLRAVSGPQIAPPPQPHVHIPSQEKERKMTKKNEWSQYQERDFPGSPADFCVRSHPAIFRHNER